MFLSKEGALKKEQTTNQPVYIWTEECKYRPGKILKKFLHELVGPSINAQFQQEHGFVHLESTSFINHELTVRGRTSAGKSLCILDGMEEGWSDGRLEGTSEGI